MFKLKIKNNGKLFKEITLDSKIQYTIGRDVKNDIVLDKQTSISRKHLTLFYEEDQWVVQDISSQNNLFINGELSSKDFIKADTLFRIQNFEFILSQEVAPIPNLETSTELNPKQDISLIKNQKSLQLHSSVSEVPITFDGKTKIINTEQNQFQLSAFLKVSINNTPNDIFELTDQTQWIIGRDEETDIMVDSSDISRKHFKIKKSNNLYYITDLNSSNGTFLNNKELRPKKQYPLFSADVIYIINTEITFEIKNLKFSKELDLIQPTTTNAPMLPIPFPTNQPSVIIENSKEEEIYKSQDNFLKKNRKRLSIYGTILILILVAVFSQNKSELSNKKLANQKTKQTGELAGFTLQQQQLIKDTYENAQNLYTQGKFEYCKNELQKVHKYINSYQQSKRLQIACSQASENNKIKYVIEQKKIKEKKTDQFIQKITEKCTTKFDSFIFKHELILCLNEAIELSPADSRILTLTEKFDIIEIQKQEKLDQKNKRKQFLKKIMSKYHYAQSVYKKGNIVKAMLAYKHFINKSSQKELRSQHNTAIRTLASIKKNFNDTNKSLEQNCIQKIKQELFKEAYYLCVSASKKIPKTHNQHVIDLAQKAKYTLALKMKNFYSEANLNESVGNVNVAKEYWNKIQSLDVHTGKYYIRAKEKLNKYK